MVRALGAFIAFSLLSAGAKSETFAGKTTMNGISYSDYAGFEEKWKFVTVRYRTDSSEQRFVWANPSAIKALEEGGREYPDGAVFAKIGVMTDEDPRFMSSRVPTGSLRYQFMVRDKAKYASTGGWGYALFDANKVTLERDPVKEAQACYACHQLVPERADVFSVLLRFQPFVHASRAGVPPRAPETAGAVKFSTVPVHRLPEPVRKALPPVKDVRSVQGVLREHVFKGTIDEIRPSLIDEVRRSGKPAALIATNSPHFALVYPLNTERASCAAGRAMKSVFSTSVPAPGGAGEPMFVVAHQDLCVKGR